MTGKRLAPSLCPINIDAPRLPPGPFGTDCASCHSTAAWSPAQYNRSHTFPLDHGEGRAASCATCHSTGFTTYACDGCHEHNEAKMCAKPLEEGVSNFENCMECHPSGREHEGGETTIK